MGTKNNPGVYDCYGNADPDEPMFILLGRDPYAHHAVRKWARDRASLIDAKLKPETDRRIVAEALDCADQMETYASMRAVRPMEAARFTNQEDGDGAAGVERDMAIVSSADVLSANSSCRLRSGCRDLYVCRAAGECLAGIPRS